MQPLAPTSHAFEDLHLGLAATLESVVHEHHIIAFAGVSGDNNPVHLDEAYCRATKFKQRIAHGMLTASYISAVFGTRLPGPGAIYISQTLNFRAPVLIGAHVLTRVEVVELYPARRRVRFDCRCSVDDKTVLEGEAMLMVPGRSG
jgi:3-hydroxybutyryl-CoA dehydratase